MKLYQNIMEELVEDALEDLNGQIDFCSCERCHNDIVACALNHLPCQYAVSPGGISISKVRNLRYQHQADIQKALILAIDTVSKYPRHDQAESEK